jgi:hypothetical protein
MPPDGPPDGDIDQVVDRVGENTNEINDVSRSPPDPPDQNSGSARAYPPLAERLRAHLGGEALSAQSTDIRAENIGDGEAEQDRPTPDNTPTLDGGDAVTASANRTCVVCGAEFIAKKLRTKTCSPACRMQASRSRANGKAVDQSDLGLPSRPVPPYKNQIADEIRRLHAEFPTRRYKWIAEKVGQPRHVIISVLGEETVNGGAK